MYSETVLLCKRSLKEKGKEMNILVLSCGTRNKVLQYFRKALKGQGNLIATDMQVIAPALYEADKFYQVPRMTDENYILIL